MRVWKRKNMVQKQNSPKWKWHAGSLSLCIVTIIAIVILGVLHLTWHLEHIKRKDIDRCGVQQHCELPRFMSKIISFQPIWCKSNKTCKISQYIIKFTAWWFRTIIEDGAYGMFHYVFHWTIGCVMSVVFSYWSRCNMYKNNVYRTMFNPVP